MAIHNLSYYDDPPAPYEATSCPPVCPATIGDYCPLFLVDEIKSLRRAASGAILLNFRGLEVILPRRALMDRHWIAQNILDLVIDPTHGRDRHISGGSFMRNSRYPAHPSLVGRVFENSEPLYASPEYRGDWIWRQPNAESPATPILVDEI